MSVFAFNKKKLRLGRGQIHLGILLVLSFSVLEEFSQLFLINRAFDLIDLSADFLGISFFGYLAEKYLRKTATNK